MLTQKNLIKKLENNSLASMVFSNIGASNTITKYLNGWISFDYNPVTGGWSGSTTGPSMSEMWYTSSDNSVVNPYIWDFGGVSLTSNTYIAEHGGRMFFNNRVNSIGYGTFYGCSKFKTVKLPCFLKSIGQQAFHYCTSITDLSIPHTVISIGNAAFYDCSSLKAISMPDSLKTVGDSIFTGCVSLTGVTLPNRLTTVGVWMFQNCISLRHLTIPTSLKYIPKGLCIRCSSLESVQLHDEITKIGDYSFWNCYSLTGVSLSDSITDIGSGAFGQCSGFTDIDFPKHLKHIKQGVCQRCFGLTKIRIPSEVTSIEEYAFSMCYGITEVTLPDSLSTLKGETFWMCVGLTDLALGPNTAVLGAGTGTTDNDIFPVFLESVTIDPANTHFKVIDDAVYSVDGTELYGGADWAISKKYASYEIPEGVRVIMPGCFRYVRQDDVDGMQEFIDELFDCYDYPRPRIQLSDAILSSVTVPSTCVRIGDTFLPCAGLSHITIKAVEPPVLETAAVLGCNAANPSYPIYVPAGSVEAYKSADVWSEFASRIEAIP